MVRNWSIVFGIGLGILWIVGLSQGVTPWMTWLDGVAALLSFIIAGAAGTASSSRDVAYHVASPAALAVGLFALWIVGLTTPGTAGWQDWLTFAFACGFAILSGTAKVSRHNVVSTPVQTMEDRERERERFHRSA